MNMYIKYGEAACISHSELLPRFCHSSVCALLNFVGASKCISLFCSAQHYHLTNNRIREIRAKQWDGLKNHVTYPIQSRSLVPLIWKICEWVLCGCTASLSSAHIASERFFGTNNDTYFGFIGYRWHFGEKWSHAIWRQLIAFRLQIERRSSFVHWHNLHTMRDTIFSWRESILAMEYLECKWYSNLNRIRIVRRRSDNSIPHSVFITSQPTSITLAVIFCKLNYEIRWNGRTPKESSIEHSLSVNLLTIIFLIHLNDNVL